MTMINWLRRLEGSPIACSIYQSHQIFFIDAVKCASLSASSANGWTRVIVEKPFGRDSESSAALTNGLKQYLAEDQIFRWIFFNWVLFVLIEPFLLIGCFDRTNMC